MKHTTAALRILHKHGGIFEIAQKIACVILIFLSIQLTNQFLTFSGSLLERELSGGPQPLFIVGVFQQIIQAMIGITLFRLIFKAGVQDLGINLRNKRLSMIFSPLCPAKVYFGVGRLRTNVSGNA